MKKNNRGWINLFLALAVPSVSGWKLIENNFFSKNEINLRNYRNNNEKLNIQNILNWDLYLNNLEESPRVVCEELEIPTLTDEEGKRKISSEEQEKLFEIMGIILYQKTGEGKSLSDKDLKKIEEITAYLLRQK